MLYKRVFSVILMATVWLIGIHWLGMNRVNNSVYAGFAASQGRFLMLTARKSDLELQGQYIQQARLSIANLISELSLQLKNSKKGSKEAITLEARIRTAEQNDKALEMQLRKIDTQIQAIEAETAVIKKVIGKMLRQPLRYLATLLKMIRKRLLLLLRITIWVFR